MGRFEVYQVIQDGNPALRSRCGFNPLPIVDDANRVVVDFRPLGIHSSLFLETKPGMDGAR